MSCTERGRQVLLIILSNNINDPFAPIRAKKYSAQKRQCAKTGGDSPGKHVEDETPANVLAIILKEMDPLDFPCLMIDFPICWYNLHVSKGQFNRLVSFQHEYQDMYLISF